MGYSLPSEEKPNTADKSLQEILSSLSTASKKSSDFVSFDTYSSPVDSNEQAYETEKNCYT